MSLTDSEPLTGRSALAIASGVLSFLLTAAGAAMPWYTVRVGDVTIAAHASDITTWGPAYVLGSMVLLSISAAVLAYATTPPWWYVVGFSVVLSLLGVIGGAAYQIHQAISGAGKLNTAPDLPGNLLALIIASYRDPTTGVHPELGSGFYVAIAGVVMFAVTLILAKRAARATSRRSAT